MKMDPDNYVQKRTRNQSIRNPL